MIFIFCSFNFVVFLGYVMLLFCSCDYCMLMEMGWMKVRKSFVCDNFSNLGSIWGSDLKIMSMIILKLYDIEFNYYLFVLVIKCVKFRNEKFSVIVCMFLIERYIDSLSLLVNLRSFFCFNWLVLVRMLSSLFF